MNIINVIVCHGNFVSCCYSFDSSGDDDVLNAEEQFRICARKFLGAHEEAIQKSFDDCSNAFLSKGKISVNLVSNSNCNCDVDKPDVDQPCDVSQEKVAILSNN